MDWKSLKLGGDIEAIEGATSEDLHYRFFTGDIVLRVNGVDFSTNWDWVPILDFAICFYQLAQSLPIEKKSIFEFTESDDKIELKLKDHQVRVSANYVEGSTVLEYSELLNASYDFCFKLCAYLLKKFPTLIKNKAFAGYLKEFKVSKQVGEVL